MFYSLLCKLFFVTKVFFAGCATEGKRWNPHLARHFLVGTKLDLGIWKVSTLIGYIWLIMFVCLCGGLGTNNINFNECHCWDLDSPRGLTPWPGSSLPKWSLGYVQLILICYACSMQIHFGFFGFTFFLNNSAQSLVKKHLSGQWLG